MKLNEIKRLHNNKNLIGTTTQHKQFETNNYFTMIIWFLQFIFYNGKSRLKIVLWNFPSVSSPRTFHLRFCCRALISSRTINKYENVNQKHLVNLPRLSVIYCGRSRKIVLIVLPPPPSPSSHDQLSNRTKTTNRLNNNTLPSLCPQLQPHAVLDGRRPPDVDVSGAVRRGRDRVAGLPPRPGLTGTVHRTPSRQPTRVVAADHQQLRYHKHDDVRAGPAVVDGRPSARARAQSDGEILLAMPRSPSASRRTAIDNHIRDENERTSRRVSVFVFSTW